MKLLWLPVLALMVYAGFCAFIFVIQRSLIYYPVPARELPGALSEELPVADGRLRLWVLRPQAGPALIYFGGNAEDVSSHLSDFGRLFPAHAVYLVNYRGYGGSAGQPSEAALLGDALAIYDALAPRHDSVALIGRSLGSAVAVHLAAQRPVERLALVTPFDSLARVAQHHFPWLPARQLIRDRYDSTAPASQITAPVLVVLAGEDEVIPRARSEALMTAMSRAPLQRVEVEQATHNSLDAFPAYPAVLGRFLGSAPAP